MYWIDQTGILILIMMSLVVFYRYIRMVRRDCMAELIAKCNNWPGNSISVRLVQANQSYQQYVESIWYFLHNAYRCEKTLIQIEICLQRLGSGSFEQKQTFYAIVSYLREHHVKQMITKNKQVIEIIIEGTTLDYNSVEYMWFTESVLRGFPGVILTVQANRKHSESILLTLIELLQPKTHLNNGIRLVKGRSVEAITSNYKKLATILLKSGVRHIIATHDFDILELLRPLYSKETQISYLVSVIQGRKDLLVNYMKNQHAGSTVVPQIQHQSISLRQTPLWNNNAYGAHLQPQVSGFALVAHSNLEANPKGRVRGS